MPLTNEDIKKVDGLLNKRISETEDKLEKLLDKRFSSSENRIGRKIKEEVNKGVEFLAGMTKNEFDRVYDEFNQVHKEIAGVKVGIADHDFKMTELVPKVQYFYLEQRVCRLEEKAGIRHKK